MFFRARPRPTPHLPAGIRLYAIGDVHGETRLLDRLLGAIKADSEARGGARVKLVLLGDVIDRGPHGAALLRMLRRVASDDVILIKGNHEDALVRAFDGDEEILRDWLPFGAAPTLAGFGLSREEIAAAPADLAAAMRARIDRELIDWVEHLPAGWSCGDYFFTHAGVQPGVRLDRQDIRDLLWIREPFLSSRRDHGKVIVHGHTVEPGTPTLGQNRIGLDTGAHDHGVLTALGLEGDRQWLLQVGNEIGEDEARAVTVAVD